jgi:hypothetical protein
VQQPATWRKQLTAAWRHLKSGGGRGPAAGRLGLKPKRKKGKKQKTGNAAAAEAAEAAEDRASNLDLFMT